MTVTGDGVSSKNPTTLADRIRSSLQGRSLNWLEGAAKLPKGYGSYLTTGKRTKINPEMMGRLAVALERDHHWLATGEGDPEQQIVAPVDTKRMHPLDVVLSEPKWSASFGLTFDQAQWVMKELRAKLPTADPDTPESVWFDERDRLCRLAHDGAAFMTENAHEEASNDIERQPPSKSHHSEKPDSRREGRFVLQSDGSRIWVDKPPKKPRKSR